jgi:hypothetical protein
MSNLLIIIPAAGIEPATLSLGNPRSIQLSYAGEVFPTLSGSMGRVNLPSYFNVKVAAARGFSCSCAPVFRPTPYDVPQINR